MLANMIPRPTPIAIPSKRISDPTLLFSKHQ
jgi:hypothetical protein